MLGVTRGGNPIQRFMQGSPTWTRILAMLESCRAASAAEGRRAWCAALYYDQGQGNRGGGWPMSSEAQFASLLTILAADFDCAARMILGQVERVPTLVAAVQRSNRPAFVSTAPVRAALASPDLLHAFHPHYAMEYATTGVHALVPGYRRLGDALGRALATRVFGHTGRMCHVARGWASGRDSVRLQVEVPLDAGGTPFALLVDSSGELVNPEGLGESAGWEAWDQQGRVPIVEATPVPKGQLHPGDREATGLELRFGRAPDMASLDLQYATSAWMPGGRLGGWHGPRGLLRCADGTVLDGLAAATDTWLMPAHLRGF